LTVYKMGREEIKEKIIDALKNVYDPEIPVNIYDLGLVYDIIFEDDKNIMIKMTVTTAGCPVAYIILNAAEASVRQKVGDEYNVKVELVLDPPWDPTRITEDGRRELKEIFGYDIVEEWIKRMRGKI